MCPRGSVLPHISLRYSAHSPATREFLIYFPLSSSQGRWVMLRLPRIASRLSMASPQTELSSSPSTRKLILAGQIAFFPTGILTTLLGPMLPILIARWAMNDTQAGNLFLVQFLSMLVGVQLSGVLLARWGFRPAFLSGLLLMASGVATIYMGSLWLGLAAVATYGLG